MPKTLPERIFFTIVMAVIMVYGMIVYNVALNTNGVTNATFAMALHEMPIMVPVAFVLEFFVVEKLATKLAFLFMRPTDRPQFITYAISLMIVCIMCPVMSLVATLLFKEPSFGMWVHTWGCNMPMALCWQMLYCGPLARAIFRLVFRRGEKQADEIVAAGKAAVEIERQNKLREADAQATALARSMCEKLLKHNLTAQDDDQLLDDLLQKAGAGNGN